jgi:Tol biopolymer transport system component
LAGCILSPLSQSCLADISPEWSGAAVKITDLLQPDTNHGQYFLAQASVMTSNGCHVAKVEGSRAEGYRVRRDGKAGRRYEKISVPVFSQDGSCLAYVAAKEGAQVVVVNDQEDPTFEAVAAPTLALSRDGKRHGYVAEQLGQLVFVIDGQTQANNELAPRNARPVFSPNGSTVAYVAQDKVRGKLCVVANGKAGELHDALDGRFFTFSADSAHLAYSAMEGTKQFRVVDGKRGPDFDGIGIDFVFSADGKRTAYAGRNGQDWFLVVDGKVEAKIEGVVDGTLTFSPDGKRLACAVAKPDRSAYILVDGKAGPVHDSIGGAAPTLNQTSTYAVGARTSVLFSPDSRRIAYLARSGPTRKVYVDGKAEDVEMDFLVGGMVFSEDSKRLAYGGRRGNKFFLVVDGNKGADYDALGYFGFSQDGKHIAFMAQKGDKCVVVVDGQERAQYDSVPAGPVFRADGALEFLAADKPSLYRIEVRGL